ncbi:MAG: tetratricopeptide repeat protein [Blastocatellia bacterium]
MVYIADSRGNPLKGIQVSTVEGNVTVSTGASGKAPVIIPSTSTVGSQITFIIFSKEYETFSGGPIRERVAAIDSPDKPIEIGLRRKTIPSVLPPTRGRHLASGTARPNDDSYRQGLHALRDQRFVEAVADLSGPFEQIRKYYDIRRDSISQADYSEASYYLGLALYGLYRLGEAEEKFQIAIRLGSGQTVAAAKFFLASCLSISGDYPRAKELLDEALAKPRVLPAPIAVLAHERLADIDRLYGRLDEERKHLQAAVELNHNVGLRSLSNPVMALSNHMSRIAGTYLKNGSSIPDNFRSVYNLALIVLNKASIADAERELGMFHPYVADLLEGLASVYESVEQCDQAEPLVQRALHIRENVFGSTHLFVAVTLADIADLELKRDRADKAREYYERARGIIQAAPGRPTLIAGVVYMALGHLESSEKAFSEAETDYLHGLETFRDIFGDSHFLVLSALYCLADAYTEKADYAKATSYMAHALELSKRLWGTTDSGGTALILEILEDLSDLYRKQGKESEAQSVDDERERLEASGVGLAKEEGLTHFSSEDESNIVGINLKGHQCVFTQSPEYLDSPESASLLLSALKAADTELRTPDREIANVLYALALISHSQAKESEALAFLERAISLTEKLLQPDPLGLAHLGNLRAVVLFALGDYARAERGFSDVVANFEVIQGRDSQELVPVLYSLGRSLRSERKYVDAEGRLQRALAIREGQDSSCEDPDSITILAEIAGIDCDQGRYQAAESRFRQIDALVTDKILIQHPHGVEILEGYAQCLRAMSREAEAANMEARASMIRAHRAPSQIKK